MLLKGIHLLVYTMGKIFTLNEVLYIQARSYFFNFIGKRVSKTLKRKILFSIIHIIPNIENLNLEEINQKVGRLIHCLDALLKSFDQYEKEILICSIRGMNLIDYLPAYLQKFIKLVEIDEDNPMYAEFDIFDQIFIPRINLFDYYFFLEDDIIIADTYFVEKIHMFNSFTNNDKYILFPHRFEYAEGVKYYIDQKGTLTDGNHMERKYLTISQLSFQNIKFSEFENPHAGLYCLSNSQLKRWMLRGYAWKDKVIAYGELESAATYSLFENFIIFNPHPENLNYLQVQHWDNKYINRFYTKR